MSKRSSLPRSIRVAALLVLFVCLVVLIVVLTDHDDEDSLPRCTGRWHSGTVDMVPSGARPCVLDHNSTTKRTGHNTTSGTGSLPTTTPIRPNNKPANPKAPDQKQPSKPKAPAVKQPAAPAPAPKRR
ncbi:hypothetical protein OG613_49025 (plasmid) [Streptomyces sp. NBC_00015]|uniref:hypothetical protein n=1 Tax=Streptomyces sp. NBC_00015 TaxID=2903611 RepID=UPI002F9076BD